jgi:hypothetical protein
MEFRYLIRVFFCQKLVTWLQHTVFVILMLVFGPQNIKNLVYFFLRFPHQPGQAPSFYCTDPGSRESFVSCLEDKEGHAKVWLNIS